MLLAFFATGSQHWLMANMLTTSTLRSFFKNLLSSSFPVRQAAASIGVWGNLSPAQDLAFPFTELHEIPVSPFLQYVEIALNVFGFKKEITFFNTEINLF